MSWQNCVFQCWWQSTPWKYLGEMFIFLSSTKVCLPILYTTPKNSATQDDTSATHAHEPKCKTAEPSKRLANKHVIVLPHTNIGSFVKNAVSKNGSASVTNKSDQTDWKILQLKWHVQNTRAFFDHSLAYARGPGRNSCWGCSGTSVRLFWLHFPFWLLRHRFVPQYSSWSANHPPFLRTSELLQSLAMSSGACWKGWQISTFRRDWISSGANLEGPSAGLEKDDTRSIQLNVGWLSSKL